MSITSPTVIERILGHVRTQLAGLATVGAVLDAIAYDDAAVEAALAQGKDAIELVAGDEEPWEQGETHGCEGRMVTLAMVVHLGTKPADPQTAQPGEATTWVALARRRAAEITLLFAGEDGGGMGGNAVMTSLVSVTGVYVRDGRRAFLITLDVYYRYSINDPTSAVATGGGF